jgi:DNA-binding transcriptional MerR regulator
MKHPLTEEDFRNLVSLVDLARKLNVNKSQLSYYAKIGILIPVVQYGKMRLYSHKRSLEALKTVKDAKSKSRITLTQIAKKVKKT